MNRTKRIILLCLLGIITTAGLNIYHHTTLHMEKKNYCWEMMEKRKQHLPLMWFYCGEVWKKGL